MDVPLNLEHGIIYLTAPYSHQDPNIRELRFRAVSQVAAWLANRGHVVYSPLTETHVLETKFDAAPGERYWRDRDLVLLRAILRSGGLLLILQLPHWIESVSIRMEMDTAREVGGRVATLAMPAWLMPWWDMCVRELTPSNKHPTVPPWDVEERAKAIVLTRTTIHGVIVGPAGEKYGDKQPGIREVSDATLSRPPRQRGRDDD